MADETKAGEQEGAKKGSPILKIAVLLVILLVAAGGGFATYYFALRPMLAPEETADAPPAADPGIPLAPVMVKLEDNFVNVIMEQDLPASTLIFGVTLECNNQMTADIVNAHLPRFVDMINKLHDSHTRSELDDTLAVKEGIQRQALQRANDLLQLMQAEPDPSVRITNVYHHSFSVEDKL